MPIVYLNTKCFFFALRLNNKNLPVAWRTLNYLTSAELTSLNYVFHPLLNPLSVTQTLLNIIQTHQAPLCSGTMFNFSYLESDFSNSTQKSDSLCITLDLTSFSICITTWLRACFCYSTYCTQAESNPYLLFNDHVFHRLTSICAFWLLWSLCIWYHGYYITSANSFSTIFFTHSKIDWLPIVFEELFHKILQ